MKNEWIYPYHISIGFNGIKIKFQINYKNVLIFLLYSSCQINNGNKIGVHFILCHKSGWIR